MVDRLDYTSNTVSERVRHRRLWLRGRPSSTAPCSRVVWEMTYPYDCMGHNRSISSANDVDIPPIDGAMDIVLHTTMVQKAESHRRSDLWLLFSYSITDPDIQLIAGGFWLLFGGLLGCVLVCFCVAEISGAVITTTAVPYYFTNSLSLLSSLFLGESSYIYICYSYSQRHHLCFG